MPYAPNESWEGRLEALSTEIERVGGTALIVEADITDRTQAEAAVQQTVERFGRLDILVNNAGLMLLGAVVGADPQEWDHQFHRWSGRVERLRRLQHDQVRRERIHRGPAARGHQASRTRRCPRVRRCHDRAGLTQHRGGPGGDRRLLRDDRGPRARGHRRRGRLHGEPSSARLHRRAVDHAHRLGLT